MILIISNPKDDAHVASVVGELKRRGEAYKIYDPATYPASSILTVESTPEGMATNLTCDRFELDLAQIKSVWYRRPGDVQLADALLPAEDKWIRLECNHLFRGVWANLHALWVSEPQNIRQASLKVRQLAVARKLGFCVPRFVITNDVDRAAAFLASAPNGVVVKVLGMPYIFHQQQAATFYTHLVTKEDHEQLDSVRFGPTFLQELWIRKWMCESL